MSRPVEFVYKLHPRRQPKKGSEGAWVLSQFLGEFYSHNFVQAYRQHVALTGRILPNDDRAIHSKLWYHFQKGYLIRRGFWNTEWKEWKQGREVDFLELAQEEAPAPVGEQKLDVDRKIQEILDQIPDREEREKIKQEPIEDPGSQILRDLGYSQ